MKSLFFAFVVLFGVNNQAKAADCQVKVDGVVKETVQATDRNDCYNKIAFGSQNCVTYGQKGYFPDPTKSYFLDQVFNLNDRVTSEYCKYAPATSTTGGSNGGPTGKLCCNVKTGKTIPAGPKGCDMGKALVPVQTIKQCQELYNSNGGGGKKR